MSGTQKSLPVFNEDLRQGDDLLVCAVLPDTVHRHTDPGSLNAHTHRVLALKGVTRLEVKSERLQ